MKKNYLFTRKAALSLILAGVLAPSIGISQVTENFDSYSVPNYMGVVDPANWTTWSSTAGSSQDILLVDTYAHSTPNAIYMENGLGIDGLYNFDQVYSTGLFNFEMWMYVLPANGAYFNFQGSSTPGSDRGFEVMFRNDGVVGIKAFSSANTNLYLTGAFPHGQWFKVALSADLSANSWELLIDGTSQGTFLHTETTNVAALNLFADNSLMVGANGDARFYIDDISYQAGPPAGINNINNILSGVEIYPNPNQGMVNINLGTLKNVTIKIMDVNGQLIHSSENINTPTFKFELNEAAGIYFIEINTQEKTEHYKLIKK